MPHTSLSYDDVKKKRNRSGTESRSISMFKILYDRGGVRRQAPVKPVYRAVGAVEWKFFRETDHVAMFPALPVCG